MHTTENYLHEIVNIIFIQKRLIIWVAAIIFAISMGIAFFWPSEYEVSGTILIKNRQFARNPQDIEEVYQRATDVDREIVNSEMKIMSSPELIKNTLLKLKNDGKFLKRFKGDANVLEEEFEYVKEKLKLELVPESNMIRLSLRGRDPVWINQFLGTLMDQYLIYRASIYHPAEAEVFYKEQADRFKNDILKKNIQLVDLLTQSKVVNPQNEIETNLLAKKSMEEELGIRMSRRAELANDIKYINKLLSLKQHQFFSSIENKTINTLSVQLQNLINEKSNLLRLFTLNNVKVKRIDEAIDRTYTALKQEINAYRGGLQSQLDAEQQNISRLNQQINALNTRNMQIRAIQIQEDGIYTEKEFLKKAFNVFTKRTEEARIATSSMVDALFYVVIVSRPTLPIEPIFPLKRQVIPIGFILALLIGCSVGFWVEYCDHTLKTPNDTEKYVYLPTLFSIPEYDGLK